MGRVRGPRSEHILVFAGNAEELADQGRGNGASEVGNEIHLTLRAYAIEQIVRDHFHSRTPAVNRSRRKRLAD